MIFYGIKKLTQTLIINLIKSARLWNDATYMNPLCEGASCCPLAQAASRLACLRLQ
jgi:hypothetical protein